jgi:prevent-host-death family protein
MQINVKEARNRLRELLDRAQAGEEVSILRRGKEVARLVPPRSKGKSLPKLTEFRAGIRISGELMSAVVIRERREERF